MDHIDLPEDNAEIRGFDTLREHVLDAGSERVITELESLDGLSYIRAYSALIELFRPKVQRKGEKAEDDGFDGLEVIINDDEVKSNGQSSTESDAG